MSLTNPSSVVTEERLSEFYQGILPYLGGMPDILANKFNKSDLYSTDEKIVGQWIDGKPLYQKTITISGVAFTTSYKVIGNIGLIPDYVHVSKYMLLSSNGDYKFVHNGTGDDGINIRIATNTGDISLRANTSWGNPVLYITVQYTKSTDSATAIGIDTDYSTTEKIIGTWIDGKPIYQKTIVGEITSSSASRAWFDLYDATDLNIDDIFFQSESNYVTSGYSIPVFGTLFSQSDNYINVAYATTSHKIQFIKYGFGAGKYKITFNYTKTTD